MSEIVSLGIKIDSTDADRASVGLDKLSQAGARTEEAAKKAERAWQEAMKRFSAETANLSGRFDNLTGVQTKMLAAVEGIAAQMGRMVGETQKATTQTNAMAESSNRAAGALDNVGKRARDAATGLDSAGGSAEKASRSADRATNSIGEMATALASVVSVAKLWNQIESVTLSAGRYEQIGIVMEVVGRNAGYGAEQLSNLQDELQKTGISMSQSRQVITQMIQAQMDLSQATQLARLAQNAATIGNISSSEALQRLVYGVQTAQVEILRNIGVVVNFETAYKKLADELGKTTTALSEQEKMQARVNVVMEQGDAIAGAYGASMENAFKQMGSMARLQEDLSVLMGRMFQPAFSRSIELTSGLIKEAQDHADGLAIALGGITASAAVATTGVLAFSRSFGVLRIAMSAISSHPVIMTLSVLAGLATAAGIAFSNMSRDGRVSKDVLDQLTGAADDAAEAFGKMNRLAREAALSSLEALQANQVREASKAWHEFVSDLEPTTARGARAVAQMRADMREEIRAIAADASLSSNQIADAVSSLIDTWVQNGIVTEEQAQGYRAAAAGALELQSTVNQTGQRIAELTQRNHELNSSSREAAGGVQTLNEALRETDEAGAKYLERLGDRAIVAGLKTQREQLDALVQAGKLVFSDADLAQARKFADHIDRMTASARTGTQATKDLASAMKSMLETHLPENAALTQLHKNLELLQAAHKAGIVSANDYSKALLSINTAYAKQVSELLPESVKKARESVKAAQEQTKALQQQVRTFGLAESAVMGLAVADTDAAIAKLESVRANLEQNEATRERIAHIDEEIFALQQLRDAQVGMVGLQRQLEWKQQQQREWEQWASDVEQIFDRVGQSLTDAIFDGGKSGRDLLRDLFKGLTFNILINPVMNQMQGWVTNQLGGMFGVQNPAQGGVGILGAAQGASSIYSALTGGLTSGIASAAAGIGNAIGSSALTSFAAGMKGSTLAAGLAGPTTAGATGAMGFGAMAAKALPYIGVGLAALSLLSGSFKGEKRYGGGYEWAPGLDKAYYSAGPSGKPSAEVNDAIGSMIASAANTIEDVFKGIGSSVSVTRLAGSAESSEKGRGGTASGGYLDIAGELVQFGTFGKGTGYGGTSGSLDEMVKNLEVDLYHSIIEAWQAGIGEFPVVLQEMIAGLDPSALTGEQAQAIVAQVSQSVQAVNAFKDAVEQLPFENLRDLSFDAAANLIQFAGGLDNLSAGLSTYFENFYSQEEQLQFATEQLRKSFGGLGLELPDVSQGAQAAKAAYRDIVESLDLNTESGQRAYATLINLSGGFAELVAGMDELNNAVVETARSAADIARERYGLETQLLQLHGDTAELRRRELEALDESNRGLQEYIWLLQDQAQANAQREGLEIQLQQALGNTAELRRRELEALDETARGLQQAIWGIQDAQNALTASYNALQQQTRAQITELQGVFRDTDGVYRAFQQSGEAAKRRLEEAFGATDRVYNAARDAAQEAQSELQSIFDSLSEHIRDLRGEVDSTARMQYDQARSVISTALVTGQLPQSADLDDALRIARDGVANQVYASRADQERAYIRLANEMEALKDIAEPELDVATQTLTQMEKQYNALRGIADVSDASLDTLRGQLSAAIATEVAARRQVERIDDQLAQAAEQMNALRGIEDLSGLSFEALQEQLGVAFSTEEAARQQIEVLEADLEIAKGQYEALMGIKSGVEAFPAALDRLGSAIRAGQAAAAEAARRAADASRDQRYYEAKLDQLRRENPNYGGVNWTTATVSDLVAVFLKEGMTPEQHYKLHGRYEGLSYDKGTSYVPYDMRANIHQGEIIIDPRSSDILRRYGIGVQGSGDNRELVAEIKRLREQVARLEAPAQATARATAQVADQFDNVTAGGNAMLTEDAATL